MKKFYTTEVWNGFLIMAGLLLCTCAYCMFLVPCEVAAGGFTGIGQLLAHITDGRISVGIVPIILNIPLFGFSIKMLGWRMGIKSVIAMMLLSVNTEKNELRLVSFMRDIYVDIPSVGPERLICILI